MNGPALFIADLHLDPESQGSMQLALEFLQDARGVSSLYILGDLFEYWIGDDVGIGIYQPVISALRQLSDRGCQVIVMHGNRDFLLGQQFALASGASVISDDELLIQLDGSNVLLMHGDTLCIDDIEYQQFRKTVRSQQWQGEFLALSVTERIAKATALRTTSRSASQLKHQSIMDVNQQQVHDRLQANRCKMMVHGHTHRPDVHQTSSDQITRYVVGDWHADHAKVLRYEHGEFQLSDYTLQ